MKQVSNMFFQVWLSGQSTPRPGGSDRFCVEYIWTIIGSAQIINNADNIYHIKMIIIAGWMNIEPDVLNVNIWLKSDFFNIFSRYFLEIQNFLNI